MNNQQEQTLLRVACGAIEVAVGKTEVPAVTSDDPDLNVKQGCFVTIKNGGRLRGCIGKFTSDKPLIELVSEMALSATTHDPRFFLDPITANELESLEVEISVLSEMELTENPASLRLGIDGIYIVNGAKSGCFLPQVATETGWTEEQFLTHCCVEKAGLSARAWEEPDTKVYLFTADAFGSPFIQSQAN